ncbi:hypothetical protein D0859_05656 [Hortaea werneckii]|uniref:Uncharacterized protein n=1 Tax=Hortaea werneckii TaxID=91943 RepID=A0A3M7IXZ9_HORWE|nr:hypothetical protein D0859_05656 [Hortaea werneckii]
MTAFPNELPDADEGFSNTVSTASSSSSSSPANLMHLYDQLCTSPKHFADCCVGISQPLLATLASRLPRSPALILSIGSGSGLLEAMLLKHSEKPLDLFGVEVSSCVNKHLPPDRLAKVPSTTSLHSDAMLASSLMFVYPRMPALITAYLDAAKPSMPSLLNPHPLRASTTPKQSLPQQPPKLSSAHIDLWEHAALLYHHFEWQTAIETFQHLFHTIPVSAPEARTRCLLNVGIIQARLGDYALAAQTLEDAARTDGD